MMRGLQDCSALLFDGSSAQAQSRLYTQALHAWLVQGDEPDAHERLQAALNEVEAWVQTGSGQVVLSLAFEAAAAFTVANGLSLRHQTSTPWLQALAFAEPQLLNREQALTWLHHQGRHTLTQLTPVASAIEQFQFVEHIESIRALIAAGDTYQVNYTFPLYSELLAHAQGDAALAAVYYQLARDLNIAYGAFLRLPANSVLSFSPELFLEMHANTVTCRPMKGTAAVADTEAETQQRAIALAADTKNRAENLMIVDLMRNDLSRLPEVVQVTVPSLFEVKRYGTVLQMTSTVQAKLHQQPSLLGVFNALFPCGSITGAPKRRTLQIIDELEPQARGAYCGAIGFIEAAADKQLHLVLNVPIRTLQTSAEPQLDTLGIQHWPLQLSVGAGITYGSLALAEWDECFLKARFFTRHTQAFELIETLRVEQYRIALFAQHLARLQKSAAALGWRIPSSAAVQSCIDEVLQPSDSHHVIRLRLTLNADGQLAATFTALEPVQDTVRIALHPVRMDARNPFLQHKTTARAFYNQALAEAKAAGLFDYVFCNENGELTEGSRSNVFVLLDGQWYTPPVSCGLLAGVQRSVLLVELQAQEQILYLEALAQAQQIVVCNALYGALQASIVI